MKRIAPEWNRILVTCNVKPITAAIWSEIFAACVDEQTFSAGDEDLRNFLAQTLHETCLLERLQENLNYSAERLMKVWPRRFPTMAIARQYERQPEKLANFVYGGRLGNTAPGDGWKYRGSGIPMITGKDNYALVEKVTGLPLVKHPDMLRQPLPALQAGIAWWERKVPDRILHDPELVSQAVNGGDIGMDERLAFTELATKALTA